MQLHCHHNVYERQSQQTLSNSASCWGRVDKWTRAIQPAVAQYTNGHREWRGVGDEAGAHLQYISSMRCT